MDLFTLEKESVFKHGGNGSAEYDSGGIRISIAEKRLPVGICLNLLLEVLKGEAVGFANSELRGLLNRQILCPMNRDNVPISVTSKHFNVFKTFLTTKPMRSNIDIAFIVRASLKNVLRDGKWMLKSILSVKVSDSFVFPK